MQWLVANMWMVLAAATFLGLIFGLSFRGLIASNQVRRAGIEREIAKTELTQAKAEVDALYAAQRKRKEEGAQAVGGDDSLRKELDERETRISSLGDELTAARAELEELKSENGERSGLLEAAGGAALGAVAGAALTDDNEKELTELRDRNSWLEERVVALEADVSAAAVVPVVEDASAADPGVEKLNWQAAYLRQRVDALEAKAIETNAASVVVAPIVETEPAPEPESPEPDNDPAANSVADEELARLRWRNRYLEGRLAYFEQDEEPVDEASAAEEAPAELAEPESEPDADVENEAEAESESESEPEPELEVEAEPEPDAAPEPADEAVVHPSEAILAEIEGTQPEQVEQPASGGDDLTAITGVGPRIAEVLNGLGIWTYSQIAAWLPENETWIENHLSFKGRVSRENWVGQAQGLLVPS